MHWQQSAFNIKSFSPSLRMGLVQWWEKRIEKGGYSLNMSGCTPGNRAFTLFPCPAPIPNWRFSLILKKGKLLYKKIVYHKLSACIYIQTLSTLRRHKTKASSFITQRFKRGISKLTMRSSFLSKHFPYIRMSSVHRDSIEAFTVGTLLFL